MLLGRRLNEELIDELEARLIAADTGVAATTAIIDQLREAYRAGNTTSGDDALESLKGQLKARLAGADRSFAVAAVKPTVVLIAGVNGSGKTTSAAKIAKSLTDDGHSVLLAAADTFRAAATPVSAAISRQSRR